MVYNDIKLARAIIENKIISNSKFNLIYPFTNENINGCFKHFDFEGKDVLSVLASSDQAFDIFLRGAKSIDTFDINPLTKYYFYLKKTAIKILPQYDFIEFLSYDGLKYLDNNIFNEISKYLKEDSYIFWRTLFDLYSDKELDFLFETQNFYKSYIPYLFDNKKYKLLQNNIDLLDTKFINCDIHDLISILDKKYDIMYLSNILGRLGYEPRKPKKSKIASEMVPFLKNLSKNLKDDGYIIANYFYTYQKITETLKILKKNNIDVSHFEKVKFKYDNYSYAGSLIYRK